MELVLFLAGCVWLVMTDMRGFTGDKRWPFKEKARAKRPDET